jgi:hypothetical protein
MTMHTATHPDDERLAAYAGGDTDALEDRELVAHLSACDRCGPLVDDLTALRGALAALPDLAPSRPLRLIPAAPAPSATSAGALGWLRRLAAPAMAAGAGLVLIGAVGVGASSGLGSLFGQAASAPGPMDQSASYREQAPGAAPPSASMQPGDTKGLAEDASGEPRSLASSPAPSSTPPSVDTGRTDELTAEPSPEQPWLTLLIAGVALFAVATALRFSLSPGAG